MLTHPLSRLSRSTAVVLSVSLSAFVVCSPILAQPAPGTGNAGGAGAPRPVRPLEELRAILNELGLSDDQKKQVADIMNETREALRAKMPDMQDMSPQDRAGMLVEAMREAQAKIKAVLTEEQRPRFEQKVAAMQQRMRGGRPAGAASRPATQPTADATGGTVLSRLERAIQTVGLTDDQKPHVRAILAEANKQVAAIRDEASSGGDAAVLRQRAQTLRQDVRQKLVAILTPEQQEKFRVALQAERADAAGGTGGPGGRNRGNDTAAPPPPMGENPDATRIEAGSAGVASTGGGDDRRSDGASLIGKPLPAFSLVKLDGRTVSQQTLAGKPSVIVFGSHSAPSFRDRVPPLQELASQYGQKVNWLIVYTAEQFPTGVEQPERNIEDKIAIAPHKQFEERAAAARTARDALKVKLDVAPDEIGNTLTTRLAGMPNAAVVVDKDGTVVAHQRWADPFAIRRAVEEALKAAP